MNYEEIIKQCIFEEVEKEEQHLQRCMEQKEIYHPLDNKTIYSSLLKKGITPTDDELVQIKDELISRINEITQKKEYRDYINWSQLENKRINTEEKITAKQKELNELMDTLDQIKYIQAALPFGNSSEEMTSSHTK